MISALTSELTRLSEDEQLARRWVGFLSRVELISDVGARWFGSARWSRLYRRSLAALRAASALKSMVFRDSRRRPVPTGRHISWQTTSVTSDGGHVSCISARRAHSAGIKLNELITDVCARRAGWSGAERVPSGSRAADASAGQIPPRRRSRRARSRVRALSGAAEIRRAAR